MALGNRLAAEAIGTAWLVIGGCGTALLTHGQSDSYVCVALAFGLTVMTMAYAIGHVSGCHLNPAVTVGLAVAKKFEWKDAGPYIAAQVVGGFLGCAILYVVMKSHFDNFTSSDHFAANDYKHVVEAFVTEVAMTFFFLFIILGATSERAPKGFAPIAIGLGLTLIHLISMKVTGTSVNPARSIGPAVFSGGDALTHLWLFVIAPVVGGGLAGVIHPMVTKD
jgi:aquaporin Z